MMEEKISRGVRVIISAFIDARGVSDLILLILNRVSRPHSTLFQNQSVMAVTSSPSTELQFTLLMYQQCGLWTVALRHFDFHELANRCSQSCAWGTNSISMGLVGLLFVYTLCNLYTIITKIR
jgi:hypothetical protein